MIRYTSQHCTHAHRNVRLGIRGFGKLMCVLIYCLLVLYFLKFCFTIFFGFASFPTLKCKSFELTLWTSDVLVSLFKDRLLIIYCNCWIFSAAVKPLKFWSCPPVNLDFFLKFCCKFGGDFVNNCVYVASIWKNNLKN